MLVESGSFHYQGEQCLVLKHHRCDGGSLEVAF